MEQKPKSKGWYLALPYLKGTGLTANRPDPIPEKLRGTDHIFADSILLTSPDWRASVKDWWDALKPGGCLVMWLPDCRFNDSPGAKITREDILAFYADVQTFTCLEDDMIDGHHFSVFQKSDGLDYKPWRKKEKHCLIIRPGAIGDAIMASSILPGLASEGFAIDFYAHTNGAEVMRSDPHIERVISTESQQTLDNELPAFWKAWGERYDRVINLTNSVEGALLMQHWRSEFYWPSDQRQRMCKGSYLQSTHDIAGVPGPFKVHFHETDDERGWAEAKARELGPFILWCLRGSAVHKWYPWTPQAVCQVLVKNPTVNIVLSGDEGCKPLEGAILDAAKEYLGEDYMSRFRTLVGTGSIRRPMALAKLATVVVGPETGVLNAVSLEPVKKICMLSHSTPSNLTDDWVNAIALESRGCTINKGACHQLHHSHANCPQDKLTGAAACAAAVPPVELAQAVLSQL